MQGARECFDNSYVVCDDYNNDYCFEWSSPISCGNKVCQNGYCVCLDECTQGARECVNEISYRICSADSEGCMKWNTIGCAAGEICSGGYCGVGEKGALGSIATKYSCLPEWNCTEWSECAITYDIEGNVKGTQTRECNDLTGCMPSTIETQACIIEEPIDVSATSYDTSDVYDIYKENTTALVARLTRELAGLDIYLTSAQLGGKPHCFNKVQDEDEEGIDCGGEYCASCIEIIEFREGIEIEKIALWAMFIASSIILIIYLVRSSSFEFKIPGKMPPVHPPLEQYIKEAREKGFSDYRIKRKLKVWGWSEEKINEAMKKH